MFIEGVDDVVTAFSTPLSRSATPASAAGSDHSSVRDSHIKMEIMSSPDVLDEISQSSSVASLNSVEPLNVEPQSEFRIHSVVGNHGKNFTRVIVHRAGKNHDFFKKVMIFFI